jgi:hypothetical protein
MFFFVDNFGLLADLVSRFPGPHSICYDYDFYDCYDVRPVTLLRFH